MCNYLLLYFSFRKLVARTPNNNNNQLTDDDVEAIVAKLTLMNSNNHQLKRRCPQRYTLKYNTYSLFLNVNFSILTYSTDSKSSARQSSIKIKMFVLYYRIIVLFIIIFFINLSVVRMMTTMFHGVMIIHVEAQG